MSSGIESLHKILKDETRTKIVLLLHEKGSLSYTELMETLGFVTTGLFNYHLKVLGDLLAKNEAGQYTLSEKGKLAARLLIEFPNAQQSGGKPKVVETVLDSNGNCYTYHGGSYFSSLLFWLFKPTGFVRRVGFYCFHNWLRLHATTHTKRCSIQAVKAYCCKDSVCFRWYIDWYMGGLFRCRHSFQRHIKVNGQWILPT